MSNLVKLQIAQPENTDNSGIGVLTALEARINALPNDDDHKDILNPLRLQKELKLNDPIGIIINKSTIDKAIAYNQRRANATRQWNRIVAWAGINNSGEYEHIIEFYFEDAANNWTKRNISGGGGAGIPAQGTPQPNR